jgi:hypothetical protein
MPGVTLAVGVTLPDPPLEGVVCGVGVAPFELLLPLQAVSNNISKVSRVIVAIPSDISTLNLFFSGRILSISIVYSPCQIWTVVSNEAEATSCPG